MNTATITKIAKLTDINYHTEALLVLAKAIGDEGATLVLTSIRQSQEELGYLLSSGSQLRYEVYQSLMAQVETLYPQHLAAVRAAL
jgi:hypothetical protein